MNFMTFDILGIIIPPYIGNFIIPTGELHHFFRGVGLNHHPVSVLGMRWTNTTYPTRNWTNVSRGSASHRSNLPFWKKPFSIWLVVWNMAFIFHFIYGMSSFPLTFTPSFFKMVFFNHQPAILFHPFPILFFLVCIPMKNILKTRQFKQNPDPPIARDQCCAKVSEASPKARQGPGVSGAGKSVSSSMA